MKAFLIENFTSRVLKVGGFEVEEGVKLSQKHRGRSIPGGAWELTV